MFKVAYYYTIESLVWVQPCTPHAKKDAVLFNLMHFLTHSPVIPILHSSDSSRIRLAPSGRDQILPFRSSIHTVSSSFAHSGIGQNTHANAVWPHRWRRSRLPGLTWNFKSTGAAEASWSAEALKMCNLHTAACETDGVVVKLVLFKDVIEPKQAVGSTSQRAKWAASFQKKKHFFKMVSASVSVLLGNMSHSNIPWS